MVLSQGVSALELATTIKLTRALWIVVLVLLTPFFMKSHFASNAKGKALYRNVPTFIVWFLLAILFNTYVLSNPSLLGGSCKYRRKFQSNGCSVGKTYDYAFHVLYRSFSYHQYFKKSWLKAYDSRDCIMDMCERH